MNQILILGVTLVTVLTSSQVVVDCFQCNTNFACETFSGGGFKGGTFNTTASTCSQIGYFPITFEFNCGSDCSDGCMITVQVPNIPPVQTCSTSVDGANFINNLNNVYSIQEGKESTYDWCSCGLSIAEIIVIAVVSVVVLCVIGYFIYRKKIKRSGDQYSVMTGQTN